MQYGIIVAVFCLGATPCPALAQADDPAAVACQAIIRQALPNTTLYRQIGAEVVGPTVKIEYETSDLVGSSRRQVRSCGFKFDAAKRQWMFASAMSAEAQRCARAAEAAAAKMLREGRDVGTAQERQRLAGCGNVLQSEKMAIARESYVAIALVLRGTYPIDAAATALKPR